MKHRSVTDLPAPSVEHPDVSWGVDAGDYFVSAGIWIKWDTSGLVPHELAEEFWGDHYRRIPSLIDRLPEALLEEVEDAFLSALSPSLQRRIRRAVERNYDRGVRELYKRYPDLVPEDLREEAVRRYPDVTPEVAIKAYLELAPDALMEDIPDVVPEAVLTHA